VAAVGHLKLGVTVGTGNDYLLRGDGVAHGKSPRNIVAEDGDLSSHNENAGSAAEGGVGRAVGAW